MRWRVRRTLTSILILVFGAITTFVLHFNVSEKSEKFDSGDFQQLHRRAAGVAVVSVRDGSSRVNVHDVGDQRNGSFGSLLHQSKKEQSRGGGIREMAWANDVPSLSDDDSQLPPPLPQQQLNTSETEFQLKLIEKELNQFALQLQQTQENLLREQSQRYGGRQQQLKPVLQKSSPPNLTIVVKEAPKYIPVAADTAAKLQQPVPPQSIPETNFRKTELNDVFIAVKTTGKYHKSRLDILLDTWVTQAKEQTYFFTDIFDEEYRIRTNYHLINTNCSGQHSRQALCCKTAVIYDTFLKSGKRWFCGVDDDNYLNVKQLLILLQDYKHEQDVYLGRASLSHPIEAMDRDNAMQRVTFWFATGGAGYCISRSLALKMSPYASGGTFKSMCNRIRLPDDVSIGFIIETLLKQPLTRINKFNSHLQSLRTIKPDQLSKQITLSYGIDEKRINVVQIPNGAYSETQDPTRFKSLHCLLNPTLGKCPHR
ncbi:beta-1,3-N-acetylglucosaminyltransferase radical fringe-like [Amphiura filiformis]|uniref:beta-1,3-N-acetylglucosaminyltransferase radical fringe-like n=1 Tax=Amphiura filiformis TaxID=82378 RepID=UPI003B21272B